MLINPKRFATEKFIISPDAAHPLDLREDGKGQIQQAGFDVRVAKIQRISGRGKLGVSSKTLPTYSDISLNQDNCYVLRQGAYAVDCIEHVHLPVGFEGKLIHRSTMNRSACYLTGSVYDPGYKGLIGGTLYVYIDIMEVELYARIGQFQIQTAEEGTAYNGDYQHQKSHEDGAKLMENKKHVKPK